MKQSIEIDLGLNIPYIKGGNDIPVRNCWHFYTNGDDVDIMFCDRRDYTFGMNRIYSVIRQYDVVIMAFVLMDTHIHFVLYGDFDDCNRFMHEYLRLTSQYIAFTHGDHAKLQKIHLSHQVIDTDYYLKTVICYVIKNAVTAGMPFLANSYPWSSGPLYFTTQGYWSSPVRATFSDKGDVLNAMYVDDIRRFLGSRNYQKSNVTVVDELVFPGEYVDVRSVERLFRTHKSFSYFLSMNKDAEVESRDGAISYLSIPLQEMRQHRKDAIHNLFGDVTLRQLSTSQRLRLAKELHRKYNSSVKQIARLCGLVYNEIKDKI